MSVQTWLERNRFAVAATVALGIAAGSAYYFLSVPPTPPGSGKAGTPDASKKRKSKKKKGSKKTPSHTSHGFAMKQDATDSPFYPVINDWAKVRRLKEADRKELGEQFKAAGNWAFNNKKLEKALNLYSDAINCCDTEAVYYSNRAAVSGSLQNWDGVVEDATKALKLRPDYVKCYSRRGVAYEKLEDYNEAVMDFTAACILSNFEDEALGKSVDRVLRLQAEKIVSENKPDSSESEQFPSPSFISAYLQSFHKRELPKEIVEATAGGSGGEYDMKLAFDALSKENLESYRQAFEGFRTAIANGLSTKEIEALAYEWTATFRFLINDMAGALEDINRSIELHPTPQALIKRSSLNVEMDKLVEAQADFKRAEEIDPQCPDFHYQSAQLAFLQQNWEEALKHYEQSIKLDEDFILAQIQLAVTLYRMGSTEIAKRKFSKLIEKHPENSSAHNYYGEILLDLKDVDGAFKMFDKAIELEKARAPAAMNVLPLINKALSLVSAGTGPEDVSKAVDLCRKAVAIDPASDVAVGTLAQFCLQQGVPEEAIKLFERNAELARTPTEKIQAITFALAAKTQLRIAKERPILRERLELLSRIRN